ncbi:hypothetical protein LEP1GSC073_0848 [Leptospira noguchii str. Cascata]|nr:hypothetical protein LEP1GSC073_0848 [Leptospira noguchii str. Cascata]
MLDSIEKLPEAPSSDQKKIIREFFIFWLLSLCKEVLAWYGEIHCLKCLLRQIRSKISMMDSSA